MQQMENIPQKHHNLYDWGRMKMSHCLISTWFLSFLEFSGEFVKQELILSSGLGKYVGRGLLHNQPWRAVFVSRKPTWNSRHGECLWPQHQGEQGFLGHAACQYIESANSIFNDTASQNRARNDWRWSWLWTSGLLNPHLHTYACTQTCTHIHRQKNRAINTLITLRNIENEFCDHKR